MYLNFQVRIPDSEKGVTTKRINGVTYIYYTYERNYVAEKRYTVPKATTIGKRVEGRPDMMYPNANYLKYFPDAELPEETRDGDQKRSGCLRIGTYLVIRQIISEYGLDRLAGEIIGKDSGLFLDLAAYSIVAENNAGQYYPDYAWNHPLFTEGMRPYSDSKVSEFLKEGTADLHQEFLNEWNRQRNGRERIYISYDSTNKHCQAGDIDLAEFGHEKEKTGKPVFNYAIAYDQNNREPLFYEKYPGSINDVSQLQYMLEKAKAYGYSNIGFILDRGYFSKPNIRYMDQCEYDFIIMVRGMKDLVSSLVLENLGSFEQKRANSIRRWKVSGKTVRRKLFETDEKKRHFHIYYSEKKHGAEREELEHKIDVMAKYLKEHQGEKLRPGPVFEHYFDLVYYHEGQKDEAFMLGREKTDVIDREISLCGYFVLITSQRMTASEALDLYKGRDSSEKLFRGDKSYLGDRSMRVYANESMDTKILVEFVALIIRNRIYTRLKDEMWEIGKKENYMTVPAAVRELEKIEMIRSVDGKYHLDHAVSATQKAILKAFGMTASDVKKGANELSEKFRELTQEDAEMAEAAG